jgi:hypothetical protein
MKKSRQARQQHQQGEKRLVAFDNQRHGAKGKRLAVSPRQVSKNLEFKPLGTRRGAFSASLGEKYLNVTGPAVSFWSHF